MTVVETRKPTLKHRLEKLVRRKLHLEERITDELKRPVPDTLRLQAMKRLRLRAKDEITVLYSRLRHGSPDRPFAA